MTSSPFTDPTITPGVTAVKAAHVQELRNLLKVTAAIQEKREVTSSLRH